MVCQFQCDNTCQSGKSLIACELLSQLKTVLITFNTMNRICNLKNHIFQKIKIYPLFKIKMLMVNTGGMC